MQLTIPELLSELVKVIQALSFSEEAGRHVADAAESEPDWSSPNSSVQQLLNATRFFTKYMWEASSCNWMLKDHWLSWRRSNCWNKFGLSRSFDGWVKVGRRRLTTRVLINGSVSDIFPCSGVTCQGFLLSPLWLALAEAIRTQQGLSGVWRISLYADDILLFITNPDNSIHQGIKSLIN